MPILKNVNPLGEVDFPLLGREGDNGEYADPDENGYSVRTAVHGSGCLERDEEFEVSDELAVELLKSPNFAPADDAAEAIAKELASDDKPMAQGGLIPSPGFALVGEQGPEQITPTDQNGDAS